jgi:PAS domain S-box-containing protein
MAYIPTALAAIFVGLALLGLMALSLRWFQARGPKPIAHLPSPVSMTSDVQPEAAVVVAERGGRVVFANERARQFFGLNGELPSLGRLLRQANPADGLLGLFASEGQAAVTVGDRRLQATSLRLPSSNGGLEQYVVMLRDTTAGEAVVLAGSGQPNAEAVRLMAEIHRAISEHLEPAAAYDAILEQVRHVLPYHLAEINLWDESTGVLRLVRHAGDPEYPRSLAAIGGAYRPGEGYSGWLAKHRLPLLVPDIAGFTEVRPKLYGTEFPFESYLGVPLVAGGEFVGTLELAHYQSGAYKPSNVGLLSLIGDQAAIAVRNAQRYTEQQRHLAELTGLADITRALEATSDPRELFARLTADIARFMDVQQAAFLVYQAEANTLIGQPPFFGLPDIVGEVLRISLRSGSRAEQIWREADHWLSADVQNDPAIDDLGMREFARAAGVHSLLWVPIASAGRRQALLQIADKANGGPFTPADVRLLTIFAAQAAAILDNARLVRESEARAEEADGLRAIAAATSNADLDTVLREAMPVAARLLDFEFGMVLLLDEARIELAPQLASIYGGPPEAVAAIRLRLEDPLFDATVAHTGRPFITGRAQTDRHIRGFYRELVERFQVNSAMAAPLAAGGRNIGEFVVAARRERAYTRAGLQLLTTIASQLAATVERARLYAATDKNLQRRVDQLTALTRVGREINQTLQLDRILRLVHDEAVYATRATCGTIVLFDMNASTAAQTPTVALRLGDENLGLQLTALEAEVVQSDGMRRRVQGLDATSPLAAHPGVRAALSVPIMTQALVVGLLHLHSDQPDGLDETAEEAAVALAAQTAIAVENARRFEDQIRRGDLLRRRADQLAQLFEVSRAVRSDRPLAENLETIAFGLQEAVGFNVVLISVLDPRNNRLKRTAATGLPLATFREISQVQPLWEDVTRLLREEFHISQSYFLPHETASQLTSSLGALFIRQSGPEIAGPGAWHADDVLLVPLRGSGRDPIGLLTVDNPRDGLRPDRNTIEIIEIFANQAAQAIENARLYAAAQRRAGQLLALHRVVEAATVWHTPRSEAGQTGAARRGHVWQAVAETLLAEMRGLDLAVLALRGPDGLLTVAGAAGQLRPHIQLAPLLAGSNPLAQAVSGGGPALVLNVTETEWALDPFVVALEIGSFVAVPIISQEKAAGALFVGAYAQPEQASPFEPEDLDLFTILCNQLGAGLESARLEVDIQQRAAQLAALAEVSQTLTASLRTEDVLNAVVRPGGLQKVVPYDGVTVWLRDGEQLRIVAAHGFENDAERLGLRVDLADSRLFAEMLQTQAPILVPEVRSDARFAAGELQPTQSWLGAPLVSQGRILGVIALDKAEAYFYPAQSASVLLAFASQVAAALDNARLFEESEQRARQLDERSQRLALLNRVSAKLSGTLHEEQIFAITISEVRGALEVDRALIVAIDAHGIARVAASDPQRAGVEAVLPILDRVRQSLAPLAIEDAARDSLFASQPAARAALAARSVRSLLVVPLILGSQVVALIQLEQTGGTRQFAPGEIELAQTLANQAAVAVQRARLYAEIQARVTELATINRLSLALATQLELDALVRLVGAQLHDIFRMPIAYVALFERDNQQIEFPYWVESGEARPFGPLTLGQGLTSHVINTKRPLLINQDAERVTLGLGGVHSGGAPTKAYLAAPMIVGDDVIGVLSVQTTERENVFGEADERLLTTIAANAGVAIQNARLFAQTQAALAERTRAEQARRRRNEELEALNRVTTAATSLLDLPALLQATAREIVQIFGARNSGIALLNADRSALLVLADYSASPDEPSTTGLSIPLTGNPSSIYVIETGQSLVLPQAYAHPMTEPIHELLRERHTQCLMIVPLRTRGEVIGTIGIDTDEPDREFTPAEVSLVETIAGQIAGAVENARFAQQLEERVAARTRELQRERERVATLLQVTTELSSSLDLDRVLTRALQLVTEAVKANQGSIFLVDMESDRLVYRAALGRPKPLPIGGELAPFKRGDGLVGWVLKQRQGVVIGDVQHDPRWMPLPGQPTRHRSVLAVPLIANEDVLGVMIVYSPELDAFDEDQLGLVAAAANQVGAAINNAELYRLIRDQAERLGGMLRGQQVEATKSRAILEGIADGVLVADADGGVILFNIACERILGLERQAVVNRPLSEFVGIYGSAGMNWSQAIERWSKNPNSYRPGEFIAQRLELDNQRVISVHLAPVIANEEYLGSVSVIRDISREVEVDRLKSEFVTNVSHELRTPMTSIKGYADLMLLGAAGQLAPDQTRFLEIIKSNADRLSLLVNDLLDISRIESGRVQLVMRPTSVADVIRDVVATLEGRIDEQLKPMNLQADVPPGLPPAWGDRERITQIIMNLADNAFNYTDAGGRIVLRASYDEAHSEILVEVSDSGIGIAAEDQPRLFDRFYRGEDALVLAQSGTGLGLAIAKQLAEMHGGRLELAKSEPGQGSTFVLALPVAIN